MNVRCTDTDECNREAGHRGAHGKVLTDRVGFGYIPLKLRPHPEMPSDEKLYELENEAIIEAWGGDVIALANSTTEDQLAVGRRAIWRHGCDTGMVAS